ncbi:MAG: amino acid permease [Methanobacteriota archaeon]|nr:MAG: amino acid permease [Euryarchaeota archaeon]
MSGPGPGSASVRVRVTRDLGLFDITMAALGAMVGAAIFLLVGAAYSVAGPLVLLSLAVAALVAALAGMAYAELASGRPDASGGAYVWVRSALPAPSGFVSGWLSWGGHMAASALSALGLGIFLVELVRPSDESSFFGPNPLEVSLVALAVLALSAIAHFARVHLPIRALGRLTLGKILLIVLVAVLGVISVFQPGPPRGFAVGAPVSSLDLMLGAGVLFIAFQGFEVVAQLSDQVKHPESSVPRGVFLALLLAFLVYGGFFLAVLGNVPSDTLSGWPACGGCLGGSEDMVLSGIRHFVGGPYVRAVVLIIGIVSMYGALNSNLTAAIKTSFSMARDRLLPGSFARIGGREVPPAAVALTFVGAGFLVFLTIETIAILASLAFLGLFAFVHASVVALRRGERRSAPGFRVPLVPAVPMAAIALNLAVGALLWNYPARSDAPMPPGMLATLLGGVWLAIGLAYHWVGGRRAASGPAPPASAAEVRDILATSEDHVELERYRVFLPLREFEDEALVELGARIARAKNAELSLLHVVEIPRNLPPKAIRFRYVDDRIRGLQRLARIGEHMGVDTRPVVKIGHKVYEIILDTIREEAVNLLVMGWRGERIEGDRRVLGSNIDYLIENAPCDVIVFKTQGFRRPLRRIVVLTSPIWSLEGIDDLALILAAEDHPVVEVVALASDPSEAERLKQESTRFEGRAHERGVTVEPKVIYSTQWESEALRESAEASLLMIRATSPGGLRKFALGPVEDRIVKLAKCSVLILRKGT